mmetsp:Transcript_5900/g.14116  ORF Transcript_5900/g.14116 Transcript_5900/m.14116 type:complete len:96 (+) Transcript_5900:95-382(+)
MQGRKRFEPHEAEDWEQPGFHIRLKDPKPMLDVGRETGTGGRKTFGLVSGKNRTAPFLFLSCNARKQRPKGTDAPDPIEAVPVVHRPAKIPHFSC